MRLFLAVLLALVSCGPAACTGRSQEADQAAAAAPRVKLRIADIATIDVRDVPLLMAFDDLSAHGYVIEKQYIGGGGLISALLARGDADVAVINNQNAWAAISKGAGIRTIGQFTASTAVLLAHPVIRSCRDLNGRQMGVANTTGLSPILFSTYLARTCPGTEPQRIVITETTARTAALLAGRLDAVIVPGEEMIKLQRMSDVPFHSLMSYAQQFPEVQIDGLHVRREWAAQHPEAVKDLLRAQLRAERRVAANPQVLYDESVRRLGLDRETVEAIGSSHLKMGVWDLNGGLTRQNIQATIDFLINADALPAGTAVDDVADLSFLNAVLAEIGRVDRPPSQDGSRPSR